MIVVMCFNDSPHYIEQARVAIRSIQLNSPGCEIVLYLVNFTENKFKGIVVKDVKLDNLNKITGYSLFAMYQTLVEYKQSILWLDVDVIIRGELSGILDDVSPNTLKILMREDVGHSKVFNSGVVVVGYSDITVKMMDLASKRALAHHVWYSDQLHLYKTYIEYKDNINLINLLDQPKWHDIGGKKDSFLDDSIIWHCKRTHFNESPYKEEYEYYKNSINELTSAITT